MTVNEFLVKHYHISKKEAFKLIQDGQVQVNDIRARQMQWVLKNEGISVNGTYIQQPLSLQYFAFYKPRGIECTMNTSIAANLHSAFPFTKHLFPIGRLDKESEGLLILTNDGKLYNRIALADAYKEKEYIVRVDKPLSEEALQQLASGVVILRNKLTRSATVVQIDAYTFSIVLTQGFNRQIRRMCHKVGYHVTSLIRTRIAAVTLDGLQAGEFRVLQKNAIE